MQPSTGQYIPVRPSPEPPRPPFAQIFAKKLLLPYLPFQKPHSLLSLVLNTNVTIEGSRGVICKNIDKHEDKKNELPQPRKENVEQELLLLENIPKPWFFSAPS